MVGGKYLYIPHLSIYLSGFKIITSNHIIICIFNSSQTKLNKIDYTLIQNTQGIGYHQNLNKVKTMQLTKI